jgi:hypothetical protein
VRHLIERTEIAVGPFTEAGGAVSGGFIGTLGDPRFGPAAVSPRSPSGIAALDAYGTYRTLYKLPLFKDTQAIAIAADSAIACCDLFVGGTGTKNRFRIAPGRPLIMDMSAHGDVYVSPVTVLASVAGLGFAAPNYADWQRQSVIWDGTETDISPPPALTSIHANSWPLRLEVHRGGVGIVDRKRAPYRANLRFSTDIANGVSQANDSAILYVCVDGRVRIDVHFWLDTIATGTPTYKIDAIEGFNNDARPNFGQAQPYSLVAATTLPAVTVVTKSFIGNPMSIIRAQVSNVGNGCTGTIRVDAWDE